MAEDYRELLRIRREKRVAATLPTPMGEEAVAVAEPIMETMTDISTRLALVQAAMGISMDGRTRATVTEVVNRAREDVLPSVAGQALSALGVRRVSVHGERRLVLEFDQLKLLHDELVQRFEKIKPRVEEAAERFDQLIEQVKRLEERVNRIYSMARREKEVRAFIVKFERSGGALSALENRYREIQARVQRRDQMKAAIEKTTQRVNDLPDLDKRGQALESRLAEHDASTKRVVAGEQELAQKQRALDQRKEELDRREKELLGNWRRYEVREGVIEIGEVEKELKEKRKELDSVLRQLGEKHGLLKRMLGRDGPSS